MEVQTGILFFVRRFRSVNLRKIITMMVKMMSKKFHRSSFGFFLRNIVFDDEDDYVPANGPHFPRFLYGVFGHIEGQVALFMVICRPFVRPSSVSAGAPGRDSSSHM